MCAARKEIWVAEDDTDLREMIAFVLRTAGLDVVELASGRQLLDTARAAPPPDLLVTDHQMPQIEGLDALEQLRNDGWNVPTIVVTAAAELDVQTRARALDAELIFKPCDVYALRDAVFERLDT